MSTPPSPNYDPHMDIEYLAIIFSRQFHKKSLTPDFYVCIKKPSHWEIYYTEEPCKTLKDFMPNCRAPIFQKKKYFYKAERLNQHQTVSEILGRYFYLHLQQIHFRGDPIAQINLQWLTVSGHSNPYDVEEEVYLMDNKMRISVLHLVTKSGRNIYLDLCGPQVDLHNYATGEFKTGQDDPILMVNSIKVGKPYSSALNKDVKVLSLEEPISIAEENHYQEYINKLLYDIENPEQTFTDITQNPNNTDPDRGEYLIEYHEHLLTEFTEFIKEKQSKKESTNLPPTSKHLFISK